MTHASCISSSVFWTIVQVWFGFSLHLQSVKSFRSTRWARSQILFLQGRLDKVDRFSHFDSCITPGSRISEGVFMNKERSIGIHHFEVFLASGWHPVIDRTSSIHSSNEVSAVVTFTNMAVESKDLGYLNGIVPVVLAGSVGSFFNNSEIGCKVLGA